MENTIAPRIVALSSLGIHSKKVHYQLSPEALTEQTIVRQQGQLTDNGTLVIHTGKFTGRNPKDKFFVKDAETTAHVHWNNFNIPMEPQYFLKLRQKLTAYLSNVDEVWVRDCCACADDRYKLNVRVITETPWSSLFAHNMFMRPTEKQLEKFEPDWIVMQAPGMLADPDVDGTRSPHFAVISFTHKMILIGGTGYTGEIKKGIFTVLNYLLPKKEQALSMHCSANKSEEGETALFFGLSGTGKTTLSADENRFLIGDDEHGWSKDGTIFNFEGGCYAKCIGLTAEKEPQIFEAIKPGALLENVNFIEGTNTVDFNDKSITENTRVSYPLHYISNSCNPAVGQQPKHIFFLTCDANGILPPVSKLTTEQAMYQFISGYTAKIAGTESGITEPVSTFSACFGAPFLPLHPGQYAQMLGERLKQSGAQVWLINTGWTGGGYGEGSRISLKHTRAIIDAVLQDKLNDAEFGQTATFNLLFPTEIPGIPTEILNPINSWKDKTAFIQKAQWLANAFAKNFEQYRNGVSAAIANAGPKIN